MVTPDLGTPSAGILTNASGTANSLIAGKAIALNTARTINGTSFDGTANITITAAGSTLSDTVTVAKGGTGLATLTSANLLVGAGTSNVTFIAPGTSGNVLTSNGSVWASTAPAVSGGFTLISYSTATAAASITVSSLDLDTHNAYKIIIRSGKSTTSSTYLMTVNGTTSGYLYSATGLETTTTAVTSGSSSAASWNLSAATTSVAFTGEYLMQMGEYDTTPNEMVMITGTGMTATNNAVKMATIGGVLPASNVTSIKIEKSTGTGDWRVWIFKPNTA